MGRNVDDYPISYDGPMRRAGFGAIRVALLFGMTGVAMALVLTPLAERTSERYASNVVASPYDNITTGSIQRGGSVQQGGQQGPAAQPVLFMTRQSVLNERAERLCAGNGQPTYANC